MQDPHPRGALGAGLLQGVGQQLLADQLVERLVEQELEREQVAADRTCGVGDRGAVALEPHRVPRRVGRAHPVGLGVLPLHQHELDDTVDGAVQERRVDAGAVRAADALAAGRLAEEVGRADVLERQVAARLDLQHLVDAEQVAEGPHDAVRVGRPSWPGR